MIPCLWRPNQIHVLRNWIKKSHLKTGEVARVTKSGATFFWLRWCKRDFSLPLFVSIASCAHIFQPFWSCSYGEKISQFCAWVRGDKIKIKMQRAVDLVRISNKGNLKCFFRTSNQNISAICVISLKPSLVSKLFECRNFHSFFQIVMFKCVSQRCLKVWMRSHEAVDNVWVGKFWTSTENSFVLVSWFYISRGAFVLAWKPSDAFILCKEKICSLKIFLWRFKGSVQKLKIFRG